MWAKYHPPLDENSEPDYSKEIDALPLVNAMADEFIQIVGIVAYDSMIFQMQTPAQGQYAQNLSSPVQKIM